MPEVILMYLIQVLIAPQHKKMETNIKLDPFNQRYFVRTK